MILEAKRASGAICGAGRHEKVHPRGRRVALAAICERRMMTGRRGLRIPRRSPSFVGKTVAATRLLTRHVRKLLYGRAPGLKVKGAAAASATAIIGSPTASPR